MATYAQIQDHIRSKHGTTVKTCWIAHVKEMHGLITRVAPNRQHPSKQVHPCPDWARPLIEEAMIHAGMIDK